MAGSYKSKYTGEHVDEILEAAKNILPNAESKENKKSDISDAAVGLTSESYPTVEAVRGYVGTEISELQNNKENISNKIKDFKYEESNDESYFSAKATIECIQAMEPIIVAGVQENVNKLTQTVTKLDEILSDHRKLQQSKIEEGMFYEEEPYPTSTAVVNYVGEKTSPLKTEISELQNNKEDISNKVNDMSDGAEGISYNSYPSVSAVREYVSPTEYYVRELQADMSETQEALDKKEDASNKVTVIDEIDCVDRNYPSEKAVVDYVKNYAESIKNKVGDLSDNVTLNPWDYPTANAVKGYIDEIVIPPIKTDIKEAQELIDANTIIESAEGKAINITDSANAKIRGLSIYGKTTQLTTTGSNLLKNEAVDKTANGLSITVNEDGSVYVKGTATLSYSYTVSGGYAAKVLISEWLEVGESYTVTDATVELYDVTGLKTSTFTDTSFTVPDGDYYYGVEIKIPEGTTVNKTFYPMLNKGSTALPYEPYTGGKASPSFEYPQEFVSVGSGGNITAVLYGGSNMFDVKAWFPTYSNEFNGMSYSNKDFVTIKNVKVLEGRFLPNTQYTFSFDYELSVAETNGITVIMHDASGNAIKTTWINATGSQTGHTPTTNPPNTSIAYISLEYSTSNIACDVVLKNMQINVGVAEETFEPFKSLQTATLSTPNGLPGVPVASGGNYTDENGQQYICDEIDLTRGKYVQRVNKYICTGDEEWSRATDKNNAFELLHFKILDAKLLSHLSTDFLCSHATSSDVTWSRSESVGKICSSSTNYFQPGFVFNIGTYSTVELWKADVKTFYDDGTPIEISYILAEPIERDLTDEEITAYKSLITYKSITNVFNDADAHMKVDYVADPKTYIDNGNENAKEESASIINTAITSINDEINIIHKNFVDVEYNVNKVSSITDDTADNTTYPTTKAVKGYIKNKEALFTVDDFEQGGISNNGNNFNGSGSEKRIRMKTTKTSYLTFDVSPDEGYVINVFKYDNSGTVLSTTGHISDAVTISEGEVYRIVLSKNPLSNTVVDDYKGLLCDVSKYDMSFAENAIKMSDLKNNTKNASMAELADIADNIETGNLDYLTTKYYVGKGKDYETINEALSAWNDAGNPPATIYIANGEYNERVFVEDKTIAFIGESRDGVIVRDKTGLYSNAPFVIHHGNVLVANITVITDHTGNPDFAYNTDTYMSYAFHIDGGNVGGKVTVKNVTAISYQAPAFGMGTIPDSTIRLENVEAYSFTDADAGYSLNGGAILCHMSYPTLYPEQTGNENLELVNVRAYAKNTKRIAYLPINGNTESVGTYMVINSTFASGLEDDNEITFRSTGYTLSDKSTGNSIESLNTK